MYDVLTFPFHFLRHAIICLVQQLPLQGSTLRGQRAHTRCLVKRQPAGRKRKYGEEEVVVAARKVCLGIQSLKGATEIGTEQWKGSVAAIKQLDGVRAFTGACCPLEESVTRGPITPDIQWV